MTVITTALTNNNNRSISQLGQSERIIKLLQKLKGIHGYTMVISMEIDLFQKYVKPHFHDHPITAGGTAHAKELNVNSCSVINICKSWISIT
jgi:hypothetical protein